MNLVNLLYILADDFQTLKTNGCTIYCAKKLLATTGSWIVTAFHAKYTSSGYVGI